MIPYIIICIIIIVLIIVLYNHNKRKTYNLSKVLEESSFTNCNDNSKKNNNSAQMNDLSKCQVPTLNTEQCYKSRYYECPIVNGTYLQCTNNYIPKPNEYNADCGNRTFDMVPYPWKISENCYYNSIGFTPFLN
jgi:hypothetical protein